MQGDESLILSLIDDVYAAAVDRERWPEFLNNLCAIIGEGRATFQDIHSRAEGISQRLIGTIEPEFVQSYVDHYDAINPWLPHAPRIEVGKVFRAETLVPKTQFATTEFYNDWLKPQGHDDGTAAFLQREGKNMIALSIVHADRPEAERLQLQTVFQALLPHIRRAIGVNRKLDEAQFSGMLGERFINRISGGAFVVGSGGHIILMNQEGERIVRANDGLTVRRGQLSATSPSAQARLAKLLGEAEQIALGLSLAPDAAMSIRRPSGRQDYGLLICPIGPRSTDLSRSGAVLVIVTDPAHRAAPSQDLIRVLNNLTVAEARLATVLVEGATLAEAAQRFGITYHTVRQQLKAIFGKTGVTRQTELIRLINAQIGSAR